MARDIRDKKEPIIHIRDLEKKFKVGNNLISALRGVDLDIYPADFALVFGPSGCGKTTLMNIIAGIDVPTKGSVKIRNTNIFKLTEDKRGTFRAEKMGIVHQTPYWIKSLTVLGNIALPMIIDGKKKQVAYDHAFNVMKEMKIESFAKQIPTELSGGQQQKVSLARALVCNPWIILADEPTGNLDSTSADEVMAIFDTLNRRFKRTIIMVTHNQAYWDFGTKRIEMKDGLVAKDGNHG